MSHHRRPYAFLHEYIAGERDHEPKHRGLSDEEYAAEHWRRVELAVRR